ncbi:MAG: hypothetical protein R3C44_04760 [Chloroflexota bacterium]
MNVRGLYQFLGVYSRSFSIPPTSMARKIFWGYGVRPLLGDVGGSVLESVAPERLQARKLRSLEQ